MPTGDHCRAGGGNRGIATRVGIRATGARRDEESPLLPPASLRETGAGKRAQTTGGQRHHLTDTARQENFPLKEVLAGLRRNDEELLHVIRDGITVLAKDPERERLLVSELIRAGVPDTLLRGPIHAAVIDGSNVANLNKENGRARLAYIQQVQRSAWREGYFPVIIVVDASLRHSIDRSDLLMEMVNNGEILMAPAGTSADEMLISEAEHRHAIIITNDRMLDWPAAKSLEKRHVELIGGMVTVGLFHRSASLWFY